MSKAVGLIMMVVICMVAMLLINIVQNYTTKKEADYSLLRDTTEAAMIDALDLAYYRVYNEFKIDEELFVESFIRRFSESVVATQDYVISFYDLSEIPPKVSIKLGTTTSAEFNGEDFAVITSLSGILETDYECLGIWSYEYNNACN